MIKESKQQQKSGIAKANRELYLQIKRQMAAEVQKAMKYDELTRKGITEESYKAAVSASRQAVAVETSPNCRDGTGGRKTRMTGLLLTDAYRPPLQCTRRNIYGRNRQEAGGGAVNFNYNSNHLKAIPLPMARPKSGDCFILNETENTEFPN